MESEGQAIDTTDTCTIPCHKERRLPEILYHSPNYVAVNKGFDIKINSNNREEITVEQQLRKMMPELVDQNCFHAFRFVHRLDYATSGVLCLALNRQAASHLALAFKRRQVTKYYLALVRGHLERSIVYVDVPTGDLVDDVWQGRRCTADHPTCSDPRETQTLVICLERGTYSGSPASKILLLPVTGRTHQLRVHCAHIGHRIVGDYTYSDRQDCDTNRMMLHAHRLAVDMKHEQLDLESTDPFLTEIDSKWIVTESVCSYRDAISKCEEFKKTGDSSGINVVTLQNPDR